MAKTRAILPLIILIVITTAMLSISIYYLYRAFSSYVEGATNDSITYAVIGATGLAITSYMAFIMRKRSIVRKEPVPVMTTTECERCGYKNMRKFTKGDYVYKTIGNCEKCNE